MNKSFDFMIVRQLILSDFYALVKTGSGIESKIGRFNVRLSIVAPLLQNKGHVWHDIL